MTFLANILLVVATLLTLVVALLAADARHVGGPDAMGLIAVPIVVLPQWLAMAFAVSVAASRSGFEWLHPSSGSQVAVGLAWVAVAFAGAFFSLMMAYGPDSPTMKPWAFALAVIVPAVVIAATAFALNGRGGEPALWRSGLAVLSLIVVAGGTTMVRIELADRAEARAADEQRQSEAARARDVQRRAIESLSSESPLRAWLPWTDVPDDEFRDLALTAIRARPSFEQDLAEMLRSDDAPRALRFMWLWLPDPPATLAEPAHDAISSLPAWAEHDLSGPDDDTMSEGTQDAENSDGHPVERPVDIYAMSQASIVVADKFRSSGLDFVTPIRAFAEVLHRHALPAEQFAEDVTYQPRGFLDGWLERVANDMGRPEAPGTP